MKFNYNITRDSIRLLKNYSKQKIIIYTLLISSCAFILGRIYYYHLISGIPFPLGWDAPFYIARATDFLSFSFLDPAVMIQGGTPGYYWLIAISSFLTGDSIISYFSVFVLTLMLYVVSYFLVMKKINSFYGIILGIILVVISIQIARYTVLSRQLFGYALMLYLFYSLLFFLREKSYTIEFFKINKLNLKAISISSIFSKKMLFRIHLPIIAGIYLGVSHLETFLVFSLTLIAIFAIKRKKGLIDFIIPVFIFVALFHIPLQTYDYLNAVVSPVFPEGLESYNVREFDLQQTYIDSLGGNIYLLIAIFSSLAIFVYDSIKKKHALMLMLSIVSVLMISFSLVMQNPDRAIIFLPAPILLSYALAKGIKSIGIVEKKLRHPFYFISMWGLLLSVIALIVLYSYDTFDNEMNDRYRTYISLEDYIKVKEIKSIISKYQLEEPVIAYYGFRSSWTGYYIDGIMGMEIGPHISYYGNLRCLLESIDCDRFVYPKREKPMYAFFSNLNKVKLKNDSINDHPIIVAKPFYSDSQIYIPSSIVTPSGYDDIFIIPPIKER